MHEKVSNGFENESSISELKGFIHQLSDYDLKLCQSLEDAFSRSEVFSGKELKCVNTLK